MKSKKFREAMDRAKKVTPFDRAYFVRTPEIDKDAVVYIYPLLDSEKVELFSLSTNYNEWALILTCCKDEDGDRLFDISDIEFLSDLGFGFRERLFIPAFELSGLGKDYSIKKKRNKK